MGGRYRAWDSSPFCEVFEVLGYRFRQSREEVSKVSNAPCARAWEAGGVMNTSIAQRQFRLAGKCKRVHLYSTVLNGSINWPWSGAMINKVRAWESQILRLFFRPRRMTDETWVTHKIRTSRFMRTCWRKVGLPLLTHKIADKIWTTMTWAVYDGDVPVMLALRSLSG